MVLLERGLARKRIQEMTDSPSFLLYWHGRGWGDLRDSEKPGDSVTYGVDYMFCSFRIWCAKNAVYRARVLRESLLIHSYLFVIYSPQFDSS